MARSKTYKPIGRARIVMLVLFAAGVIGITYVQVVYAIPKRDCEATGRIWDYRTRSCATLVFIPDLTGRPPPPGVKRPPSPVRGAGG